MSAARHVRLPTGVVTFALAGYRGVTLTGAEQAVHTRLLPHPDKRVRQGRVLRESNARVTSRVAWDGVGPVLLKVHRARSFRERLWSLVRRGRARAEWDAARYLAAAGAPVPEPLAVGEQRRLGMLDRSFYAARFLEGLAPVRDALDAQPPDKQRALLTRLAVLIRGLHDLGFDHRDLHSGNVLVGPGPGDMCRIVVTDLHRSRFGVYVRRASRQRAVAQWLHSVRPCADIEIRAAWLRDYLVDASDAQLGTWIAFVERRIERIERVRRKSRGKRCFKESTVYTRDTGRGWGARRRDIAPDRLDAALRAHDEAREPGRTGFVKRSGKAVVTRHGDVVVKERLATGPLARIRDAIAPRRHAAGYRNAHMLDVLEVGTAQPLAHVRRGGRSFTLYEDLSELTRLDHLARRLYTQGTRDEQVRLREDLSRWMGRLHEEGIYHGDFKGVNVLVERRVGGFHFRLIDTDHCRFFGRPVDGSRRIKNLAQLAASIPQVVTRTERMRWYRRYATVSGAEMAEKGVARAVAVELSRKIVVVDEPIE